MKNLMIPASLIFSSGRAFSWLHICRYFVHDSDPFRSASTLLGLCYRILIEQRRRFIYRCTLLVISPLFRLFVDLQGLLMGTCVVQTRSNFLRFGDRHVTLPATHEN